MTMTNNVDFPLNFTRYAFEREIHVYKPYITDQVMWYLNVYINGLCCGIIALFGTCNNIVNMLIFKRLGLTDSMSVCLFSLSLTDLLLCFVVFTSRVFPIWDTFFHHGGIDPMAIWYAGFEWVAASLFICSGWITTYLALERCICVSFPFKVKDIFTRQRSIIVVIFIYLCSTAIYMPVYTTNWLEWSEEKSEEKMGTANTTAVARRLLLKFSHDHEEIVFCVNIITGYILPFLSLTIIICSVFCMIYGLRASSKLRESMTMKRNDDRGVKKDSRLNYKTRKLVKVVLFLAIIFTACTIPRTFAMNMYTFHPDVKHDGKERNLYHFQWLFTNLSTVINSTVNVFVYLLINSSYRKKFKALFCCQKEYIKQNNYNNDYDGTRI